MSAMLKPLYGFAASKGALHCLFSRWSMATMRIQPQKRFQGTVAGSTQATALQKKKHKEIKAKKNVRPALNEFQLKVQDGKYLSALTSSLPFLENIKTLGDIYYLPPQMARKVCETLELFQQHHSNDDKIFEKFLMGLSSAFFEEALRRPHLIKPDIIEVVIQLRRERVWENEEQDILLTLAQIIYLDAHHGFVVSSQNKTEMLIKALPKLISQKVSSSYGSAADLIYRNIYNTVSHLLITLSGSKTVNIDKALGLIADYNKTVFEISTANDYEVSKLFAPYIPTIEQFTELIEQIPTSYYEIQNYSQFQSYAVNELSLLLPLCIDNLDDKARLPYKIQTLTRTSEIKGNVAEQRRYHKIRKLNLRRMLDSYLKLCYLVIRDGIKRNDLGYVFNLLVRLRPFHDKSINDKIKFDDIFTTNDNQKYYDLMADVISAFLNNKRYSLALTDIINHLPANDCVKFPKLMTALLLYSERVGNTKLSSVLIERNKSISSHISTQYTEAQLGALLAIELKTENYNNVSEILKYAKDHLISFSNTEFQFLIGASLEREDLESAWNMIEHNDTKISMGSMLSYISKMIDLDRMNFDQIDRMYERLLVADQKICEKYNIWGRFTGVFFKYITRKFPLEEAVHIYKSSVDDSENSKTLGDKELLFVPENEQYQFHSQNNPFRSRLNHIQLSLSDATRVVVLRTIYHQALHLKSVETREENVARYTDIAKWCIYNILKLSNDVEGSLHDVSRSINKGRSRRAVIGVYKSAKDENGEDLGSMGEDIYRPAAEIHGRISA